jgi:uncharacterized protein (TIGR03435 family)
MRGRFFVLLAATAVFGQEFEVASIKPTPPNPPDRMNIGVHIDGAMVVFRSLPLRRYIATAYGMREYQVIGPDWLATANFDISAKIPGDATRAQLPAMMKALLAERFKLALHRDQKEFPVYALIVNKGGPKLKEAAETGGADAPINVDVAVDTGGSGGRGGAVVNLGNGAYVSTADGHVDARRVTIPQLVESIGLFLDRPVIDMTGLKGAYDIKLDYSLDDLRQLLRATGADRYTRLPDGMDPGRSIFDSMMTFGLKLDARKAPVEVLVIDRVEKMPTEN